MHEAFRPANAQELKPETPRPQTLEALEGLDTLNPKPSLVVLHVVVSGLGA